MSTIQLVIFDIGGVLMTNGWGHQSRERATEIFGLDIKNLEERHTLYFPLFELGRLSLDEYLDHVIFDQPRNFSHEIFIEFMFAQSEPFPETIEWAKEFKKQSSLPFAVISNEGRELGDYRIRAFHLKEFIDLFIVSGSVGLRKPDRAIYQLALDLFQVRPEEVLYIEDRLCLVEAAQELGIQTIHYKNLEETRRAVDSLFVKS